MVLIILGLIIIIISFVLISHFYIVEIFQEPNAKFPFYTKEESHTLFINKTDAINTITEKTNLVLNPVVTTINHIVDTINVVPKKIYDGCMSLATTTGNKIQIYAMKLSESKYNKDDDTENAVIAKVHKEFIDNLQQKNPQGYAVMKAHAERIYNADILKHEQIYREFFKEYVTFNPSLMKFTTLM